MNKLKVLELFGGIGACSKALDNLGVDYEIVDYVEIDKYAVKSYNALHDTNFEPQDIMSWDKDVTVDLIMHGSPCQDFSIAGKQAGGDKDSGTRSSLMYETIRIVKKTKPKYVIWENVKNLLCKKHRHNFDAYLETMEQLGYTNYYQVLNAKDYGIPQNRERVFTVSILKDIIVYDDYNNKIRDDQSTIGTLTCNCGASAIRNGWKILENTSNFIFPTKIELSKTVRDFLDTDVEDKYYLSQKAINYILDVNGTQLGTKWENSTKNGSINKHIAMTIGCRSAACQRAGITNYIVDNIEDEIPVENAKKNLSSLKIRKLTPRECWRLMGFEDEDFNKASKVNSNAQLYKQAGNSIVVTVLEAILKELL